MRYIISIALTILFSYSSLSQKTDSDRLWGKHIPSFREFYKEELVDYETYVFADTLFIRDASNLKGVIQDTIFVGDDIKIVDVRQS